MSEPLEPIQPQASSSLTGLIGLICDWQQNKLAQINHLANIPDSEILEVTDEDTGKTHTLQGKEREAFLYGLLTAASMFSELPFRPVPVEPEATNET